MPPARSCNNYYIENTCITLEEEPVTPEEFGARVARITKGYPYIVSIITSDNAGSLRFHRKNGFTEVGMMHAVAFKFGKYLDVSFFQKHLD